MGDKYRKTVKEETMDKLNMTSKEYDKIQQMYFSQDPEAYSDVANSIAKEDKRRMDLNKQMELKELDKKIKPLQSKGTLGPRDIHKIVFQFNIPMFDSKNESHLKLSKLGIQCNKKTPQIISKTKMKSIARIRKEVREGIEAELAEIDKIVSGFFA